MNVITIEPGVWTRVEARTAIQSKNNQSGFRIVYSDAEGTAPPVDTEAYFLHPEYATEPHHLPGRRMASAPWPVFVMPDEAVSLTIVVD